ncbi:translation termination factor GTPase eRF3 [Phlyctochytrium planicorne]|nr:translation termination factor GTPase eRF3 [Phlyctochytrium planicorne]KAJ3109688.1 translation termination factor GTPase eRF3 [Phlyctochytrium planicorne]
MSNPPKRDEERPGSQNSNNQVNSLNQQFARTGISGGSGGQGQYNFNASEFVPSASSAEFVPQGYGQGQYYQQPNYYQGGRGGGYQQGYGGYQQGYNQGYGQQQQYNPYGNPYQQGYNQQQAYNPNMNYQGQGRGGYQNQNQYQQQQAYTAPAPKQQAYVAPNQQKSQPAQPSKGISIGSATAQPSKGISIGSAAPSKSISLGAATPSKSISLGSAKSDQPAAAATPISIGSASSTPPAKPKEEEPAKSVTPSDSPKPAAKEVEEPKAEKKEKEAKAAPTPKKKEEEKPKEPVVEYNDDEFFPEDKNSKEHVNLVFIGHVDAGKSTMGGHLLFLTGMVDKRTLEKYEREAKEAGRESWYLSWALDLNQEERAKGKTVEYGRGFFETEKRRYTILDAPGHKNFVPSMMQGAAQADFGVLVISARKGEFETGFEKGGQTREHAMLAKTVGVKRLIIVINKMDDPTVKWDKERYDECVGKIMPFLRQVGYSKADIDVMPVSGFTGANLKDRVGKDICPYYDGPSLLELLDGMPLDRKSDGPLIMPISDKFKDMGTVVLGKIESGRVKKGQNVMVMPNKKMAEIMTIYMEDSEKEVAQSGENVRLRLKNVEEEDVLSGFVLCTPKRPVHAVTAFEARLAIVEYKSIICAGYTAVCHAHTNTDEVVLTALLHKIDKKTGKRTKNPPQFVRQGDSLIARIETSAPICLERFDEYPQLGRFTLRDEGKTVAVGRVTKLILNEEEAN